MNGENGNKSKKVFTHDELNKALMDFEDLAERCFMGFFPRLITADCVKFGKKLEGDAIYLAVSIKDMRTRYVNETVSLYLGKTVDEVQKDFEYLVDEVPVKVQVYTRNYNFYKYPDRTVYEFGDYLLPNPWNTYWKSRWLVK